MKIVLEISTGKLYLLTFEQYAIEKLILCAKYFENKLSEYVYMWVKITAFTSLSYL